MQSWYAVHTQPRAEAQARHHLERQGFSVYLPQYLKRRRHARRVETVTAPLFPRYLFVGFDPESCRWRAVHSTMGVCYMITNGDEPVKVPESVISQIRDRENEAGLVELEPAVSFRHGQKVQILGGALSDQMGLFDCVTDQERVQILIELLGRPVKVRVPLELIAAAG